MKTDMSDQPVSESHQQAILDKLDLILKRIDMLEERVGRAEAAVHEIPGIAATAVNTVDAYFGDHADQASELGVKVPQAIELLEKLVASDLLDTLELLTKRIDQFQPWLAMLADLPGMAVTGVDSVDDYLTPRAETFSMLAEQMPKLLGIFETLTHSGILDSLEKIAHHAGDYKPFLDLLADVPGSLITAVDSFDEVMSHYKSNGIDVLGRGRQAFELAVQMTEPQMLQIFKEILSQRETLQMLVALLRDMPGIVSMVADTVDEFWLQYAPEGVQLDSMMDDLRRGVFDPVVVSVVASAGRSFAESAHKPSSAGVLDLLKFTREPEFRKTMGFLLAFVRDFSHRLDSSDIQKSTTQNGRH